MRRLPALAGTLAAALVSAPGAAPAQAPLETPAQVLDTPAPAPRNALSLPLLSLAGAAGLGIQYERQLDARRWSLAVAVAARENAGGDYESLATSASIELRYWLQGRAVWSDLPARSMAGWFAGARFDTAWIRTRDELEDRSLGSAVGFAETATFGYRFAVRRRVEITPSIGLGVKTEVDASGRLPAWTRGDARLGVTLGWLY